MRRCTRPPGTRYILFDEVKYTENWELWMKVIYDSRKDIRLIATGSASPVLEKGSADSGTGRWNVLKIPTMSFYEYCRFLDQDLPLLPDDLRLSELKGMSLAQLGYFRKAKDNQKEVDAVVELPRQKTMVPILRVPAIAFLYILKKLLFTKYSQICH